MKLKNGCHSKAFAYGSVVVLEVCPFNLLKNREMLEFITKLLDYVVKETLKRIEDFNIKIKVEINNDQTFR